MLLCEFQLNIDGNFELPKSCMLLLLRFSEKEDKDTSRMDQREELGVRPVLVKTAPKLNSLHEAKEPMQKLYHSTIIRGRSYDQNIKDCLEAQKTRGN